MSWTAHLEAIIDDCVAFRENGYSSPELLSRLWDAIAERVAAVEQWGQDPAPPDTDWRD